jgi:dienelactone hydrolase
MEWKGEGTTSKGVTERGFDLEHSGRSVPGIVWTAEEAKGPTPVVLIGHGGSGHKREPHILALARRLVRHHGIAAAAIDGPLHGDRARQGEPIPLAERRAALRDSKPVDGMIADWKATLDALQKLPEIGIGKVGYWGLSMGTMFGLPFVASEPRIAVATLGLMGTGVFGDGRLERDAESVTCPVLFLQQWDDELIPRENTAALFGAIRSADKRLHAHPGAHAAVPREEFAATEAFLAERLR